MLARAWAVGFATCLLLAPVELAVVGLRIGEPSGLLVRYGLSLLAEALWVSGLAAACVSLPWRLFLPLWAPRRGSWLWRLLLGSAIGAAAGGVGVLILRPWNLADDPYRLALVVPTASGVTGVLLASIRGGLGAPLFRALCLVAALSCLLADAFVLRRLYATLHDLAGFAAMILGACTLWDWTLRASWRRLGALAAVGLASHLSLGSQVREVRVLGDAHGMLQPQLLATMRLLLDLDRDGHAGTFAGTDCDDGDPEIAPGRCELPDPVDRNCNGLSRATAPVVPARRPAPRAPLPDVYLLVTDTVRADWGGLDLREVPDFARWKRGTVDFARAYTPYPETYRAMLAMAQSRYLRYTGLGHPSVFELMDAAGYDADIWIHQHKGSAHQGKQVLGLSRERSPFQDDCDVVALRGATARLVDWAIEEARSGASGPPRMRWLHFLDAHAPYAPWLEGLTQQERYRTQIRHVLMHLGRLVAELEQSERGRAAVVIMLSDHGEEFGEHGSRYHGGSLYEEALRVPLYMRLPGVSARVITDPVSLVDVVPTLLAYLGLPQREGFQGRDLLGPALPSQLPVVSQLIAVDHWGGVGLPAQLAVMSQRYKLIVNLDDNLNYLYDLESDPGERVNLALQQPQEMLRLRSELARWEDLPGCRELNPAGHP